MLTYKFALFELENNEDIVYLCDSIEEMFVILKPISELQINGIKLSNKRLLNFCEELSVLVVSADTFFVKNNENQHFLTTIK